MLDVHIAVSADTRRDWVDQCLESVARAADAAAYPVNVWRVDGVPGHIGRARQAGYARGAADYVTYVDDDDFVFANAFACLSSALAQAPAAVFTRELQLHGAKRVTHRTRHHLAVYRRDVLAEFDFAAWPSCGDVATRRLAERHRDGVLDVAARVYVHRVYPSSRARVMRCHAQAELARAQAV